MISSKDLKDGGFKELQGDDRMPKEGKYYQVDTDDIFNYKLYIVGQGRVYKTTINKLAEDGFTVPQFITASEQDIKRRVKM